MKKTLIGITTSLLLASSLYAVEKVYATVNGENITSEDIAVVLRDPRVEFDKIPTEHQKKILDSLIEQKLLAQFAMQSDVTKSNEYKQQLEKLKQTAAFQIWVQQVADTVKVDDKEIKAFYDKNKSSFKKPLQMKASHILVKTEDEAKQIITKLKKSNSVKATFTDLAKEKSVGPTGANGGDLGWFTQEKMVPEFSEAASKLKVGSYTTQPVKTQFGFHVILLDDKKEASNLSFDEVKNQINQQLAQEKFMKTLKDKAQDLRSKAKIQIK